MRKDEKRALRCMATMFSLFVFCASSAVHADTLPADPWATSDQTVHITVQQVGPVIYGSQPYQPTYEGGEDNIWNTQMPEFTGEMTQWTTGGKFNAPEVNMHNLFSMTYHLRNMGYDIPDSLIEKMKAAPAGAQERIASALNDIQKSDDPASKMARFFQGHFESETGLSVENLIDNSFNLMTSK